MGQRHQIYVMLPEEAARDGKRIIGIHHQWLYGHTAVRMAERFLTFVNKADRNHHPFARGWEPQIDMLKSIYSCDPDEGYYHNVHILEDGEPEDPRMGDNNDGITVFDLRNLGKKRGKISYCFSTLYEHDVEREPAYMGIVPFTPLSARQYCRLYYPEHVDEVRKPGFAIIRNADGTENEPENRVRRLERFHTPVMTPKALHGIWPNVFPAPAPPRPPLRLVLPDLGDSP